MTSELLGPVRDFLTGKAPSVGSLAVLGDLALDRYVFGAVERISPEAPVPVLLVEKREDKLGCAANVVANLCYLLKGHSSHVLVFGVSGKDSNSALLVDKLSSLEKPTGIKLDLHIQTDVSRPTTVKTRMVAGAEHRGQTHQLLRVDEESTAPVGAEIRAKLCSDLVANLSSVKCLLIQDYAKGVLSPELLSMVFKETRARGVWTILDPNRNTPGSWYRGASLITPNVSEAEALLGEGLDRGKDDARMEWACATLVERLGVERVMLTRSAYGMTLRDFDGSFLHLPAVAQNVFDVTGAGDTVVAALAAGWAAGLSLRSAAVLAVAAAGVVVAKVGTAVALPEEILTELDRLQKTILR